MNVGSSQHCRHGAEGLRRSADDPKATFDCSPQTPERRSTRSPGGSRTTTRTIHIQGSKCARLASSSEPKTQPSRCPVKWGQQHSSTTRHLYSMLCVRCLAMGFILQKPGLLVNSLYPNCPAQGAHSNRRPIFCSKPFTLQQVTQEQTTQKLQI